jgi:hypothetical protein
MRFQSLIYSHLQTNQVLELSVSDNSDSQFTKGQARADLGTLAKNDLTASITRKSSQDYKI